MGHSTRAAVSLLAGLAGLAGCNGPYRPMMYRNPEAPPADYGMPVTEGPILSNGASFPVMPGTMMPPGTVVTPGMPPPAPPVMPPASGTPPPPLNAPPIGPMPRAGPPPATTPTRQ